MVATTRVGTSALGHRGWATVRHARTETWPITYEWLGASDTLFPYSTETLRLAQESPVPSESWNEENVEPPPFAPRSSEEDKASGSKDRSEEKSRRRRVKTMSECTDSSLSQNMLEIGPSPLEPSFPFPGKLTEKISNWLSSNSSSNGKGEVRNGSRRYSEGGKSGSSFTRKLRDSINRKRSKTISTGWSFNKLFF